MMDTAQKGMQSLLDELSEALEQIDAQGLRRHRRLLACACGPIARVDQRNLVSFCSNDYLGLANDPRLVEAACEGARQWGVGSGASHLVSGHMQPHDMLEEALAAFVGCERALLFSTGYMANLGIITTLVGRKDAVFADKLNHASLIDAVQLSRADSYRYAHNDLAMLENMLRASDAKRKLILTDAVFSMDGDLAPLPELYQLAERYNAWLVVDDAHGFGVLGKKGNGSLAHFDLALTPRVIYMGTLGKAAGVSGAFVAGAATVIETLIQRARSYIFTTGASPIMAHTLLKSLTLIEEGIALRQHLRTLTKELGEGLHHTRWQFTPSPSAIQPIMIGENQEATRVAKALLERGLWVPAIRPPTVPKGTARLRISLSAAHTHEHVATLVDALTALQ